MTGRLVLATRNEHKVHELRQILQDVLDIDLTGQCDFLGGHDRDRRRLLQLQPTQARAGDDDRLVFARCGRVFSGDRRCRIGLRPCRRGDAQQ